MYGSDTLHVRPRGSSTTRPRSSPRRSASSSTRTREQGLAWARATPRSPATPATRRRQRSWRPRALWDGHIFALHDGSFTEASDGLQSR